MERILTSQPHLFAESLVRQIKCGHINTNGHNQNQTEAILDKLILPENKPDFEALMPFMPEVNINIIATRAFKKFFGELKVIDSRNPFGSMWNEWSAVLAANQLGIPIKDLHQVIDGKSPTSAKLREAQAKASEEIEALLKKSLSINMSKEIEKEILLETWVSGQLEEIRKQLEHEDLSKNKKGELIFETIKCLVEIISFAKGQKVNLKQLRDRLLNARLDNTTINIVALHCLSFRNSPTSGISVASDCNDFVATNSDDSKVLITQNDSLDKVNEFVNILKGCNVKSKVTIVVIDNDAFVGSNQEGNIANFCDTLKLIVSNHPLAKHNVDIIKATNIMDTKDLDKEWERLSEKQREKLVDEEFEKLNRRTLPAELQTRDFARKVAKNNFLVQITMGATIPVVFDNSITLQRAKAHQQATQLFNSGAKLTGSTPIILTHWKNMKTIE